MTKQNTKKWSDYMWIVSATYFALGFFNIVFAWLGVKRLERLLLIF